MTTGPGRVGPGALQLPRFDGTTRNFAQQLSWLSSGKSMVELPRPALFDQGVQDGEQFAHAGSEGDLLGLARLLEGGHRRRGGGDYDARPRAWVCIERQEIGHDNGTRPIG